jgi:hypothetical protein
MENNIAGLRFPLSVLCAAVLLSGAAPSARAWDDPHDHGWQLQVGDPSAAGCETWEFTAQTPNTKTDKLITAGQQCASFPDQSGTMQTYCRPTGQYFTRSVTVNIGARALQPWEKEELNVCLDQTGTATIDTSGMLYQYTTSEQDSQPFLGTASSVFTLTPGAKLPSAPSTDEIAVQSSGKSDAGGAVIVLVDNRAAYFKGETITFSISGMLIPVITPGEPADQVIGSFLNFDASMTMPVAPTYQIPIPQATKSGNYTVTITFSRQGPLSTGTTAATVAGFTLP